MATHITTLKDATNTDALLPKTVLKAVADDNGNYLDNQLTAADVNILKNGKISDMVSDIQDNSDAIAINAGAISSLSGGDYSHSWTFESFVSAGDGRIFVYGGHMVIASVLAEFSTTVSTGTVFATLPSAIKPSTNIASLFCFNYNTSNDTVATMRGTACTLNTSGQVSQSIGNIGTQRRLLAFFVWFI